MTKEKKERLKFEKIAEDVTTSEHRRVKDIQLRYQEQLKKMVEHEKEKVESHYRWNLENYKN